MNRKPNHNRACRQHMLKKSEHMNRSLFSVSIDALKDKLTVACHNNKDILESENDLKLIDKSSNVVRSLLKIVKVNCHD